MRWSSERTRRVASPRLDSYGPQASRCARGAVTGDRCYAEGELRESTLFVRVASSRIEAASFADAWEEGEQSLGTERDKRGCFGRGQRRA